MTSEEEEYKLKHKDVGYVKTIMDTKMKLEILQRRKGIVNIIIDGRWKGKQWENEIEVS